MAANLRVTIITPEKGGSEESGSDGSAVTRKRFETENSDSTPKRVATRNHENRKRIRGFLTLIMRQIQVVKRRQRQEKESLSSLMNQTKRNQMRKEQSLSVNEI